MTATLPRPVDRTDAGPRPLRRRRSSRLLLLAVVLAVVGALLGVYAYRGAVSREGVVAVARPLPFGAVIQLTDLREVQLPPDTGLATVAWRDVNSVIGSFTATDLHVGQTLTPESVTSQRSPAPGQAVVGLSVDAGQVPATPLAPRDDVLVIVGSGSPPRRASVVHAGEVDVSGRRSIDVLVPQADAEELALASMENRVAIVLVGRG
ncbi:SAF domain-containing protein [Pseudonocardia kunmingensis]|uniref:SAF domain-containing protein n=1 Tax=Pseudonocardia kunmingensis TaxID=630975 RepID=A0A543DKM9_9PSEU|nr:SAF domain-containing protein [Pseudonocardia kunmingensis]